MIIRGGQNIYPAEIEEHLVLHPYIQEAVVVGVPGGMGGESIWAFVILEEGSEMSDRQVLDHCRAEMEAYSIPDRVQFMADFPRSGQGKPQTFKLREVALQQMRGKEGCLLSH